MYWEVDLRGREPSRSAATSEALRYSGIAAAAKQLPAGQSKYRGQQPTTGEGQGIRAQPTRQRDDRDRQLLVDHIRQIQRDGGRGDRYGDRCGVQLESDRSAGLHQLVRTRTEV